MPQNILNMVWPEWTIGRRLGSDGYSTTYEVRRNDSSFQNFAAVKIVSIPSSQAEVNSLQAAGMDMPSIRAHFQNIVNEYMNESRLMASMAGQSNIVSVRDYKAMEKANEFGWNIVVLMEYLTPFADYFGNRRITESEVIRLGTDICTALEVCAKENIVHRDIKPENILVHKSGAFKLGSLGLGRKPAGMVSGVFQRNASKYMSPEAASGAYLDSRGDVYALGMVLYELLNDRRIPFLATRNATSAAEINAAVGRRNAGEALPPPSNASQAMADVILRACAFDPGMRFSSAAEMKQALAQVSSGTYVPGFGAYGAGFVGGASQRAASAGKTQTRQGGSAYAQPTPQPPVGNPQPAYYPPSANASGGSPNKSSKALKTVAAVIAAVLLLCCGFLLARSLGSDNNSSSPDKPATLSTTPSDNTGSSTKPSSTTAPAPTTTPAPATTPLPATTPVPTTTAVPLNTAPALYGNTLNLDSTIKASSHNGASGSYLINDSGKVIGYNKSLDYYGPSGIIEGMEGLSEIDGKGTVSIVLSDSSIYDVPGNRAVIVNVDSTGVIYDGGGTYLGHLDNGSVDLPTVKSMAEWSLADENSWQIKFLKEDANIRTRSGGEGRTYTNLAKGTLVFMVYKEGTHSLVVSYHKHELIFGWVRWASLTSENTKNCQLYNVIRTDTLHVRDIPSTEGVSVHKFRRDNVVEAYGHFGEWYYVYTYDGYGWCHEDYLEHNTDLEKEWGIYVD